MAAGKWPSKTPSTTGGGEPDTQQNLEHRTPAHARVFLPERTSPVAAESFPLGSGDGVISRVRRMRSPRCRTAGRGNDWPRPSGLAFTGRRSPGSVSISPVSIPVMQRDDDSGCGEVADVAAVLRVGIPHTDCRPLFAFFTRLAAPPGFVFYPSPAYIQGWKLLCRYRGLARHTSGRKPTF